MSTGEAAYLTMTISACVALLLTLAWADWHSGKSRRAAVRDNSGR